MTAAAPKQPPKVNVAVPLESAEQAALIRLCRQFEDQVPALRLIFAIPNGSHKSRAAAVRFKREGLKAGVPDLFLPVARHGCPGLFLELKRQRGGVVSDEQKQWHLALMLEGYEVKTCKGAYQAWQAICDYLELHAGYCVAANHLRSPDADP